MIDLVAGVSFSPLFSIPLFDILPLLATATEEASAEPESVWILCGVLLSLVAIFMASKIGGEFFNWLGFPPVLGELVGGVVIGVSALHLVVFPENGDHTSSLIMTILQATTALDPQAAQATYEATSEVLSVLAELGVIILLFEIGLESNVRQLLEVGIQSLFVAVVGVTVPFAAGTAGLILIFHTPPIAAIFAGAALTATSIGITSRVLAEIGQLSSTEGQIILGAAVMDDILGIIVLAVVASLAKTGEVDVLNAVYLIISASVFLVGAILLGRFFNSTVVALAKQLKTRGRVVIPALTLALILAYIAAAINLEAILGAFAAGLVLDETDIEDQHLENLIIP
jgi:Kef-type K+ transport system membrane component KefB